MYRRHVAGRLRGVTGRFVDGLTCLYAYNAADPGRFFTNNLCWNGNNGCAGDVRLYDWEKNGDGIVRKVLFTARDGATISGRVWATRSGKSGVASNFSRLRLT